MQEILTYEENTEHEATIHECTYIYMNIIIYFDVEFRIPHSNCSSKIYLRFCRQFEIPLNMILPKCFNK